MTDFSSFAPWDSWPMIVLYLILAILLLPWLLLWFSRLFLYLLRGIIFVISYPLLAFPTYLMIKGIKRGTLRQISAIQNHAPVANDEEDVFTTLNHWASQNEFVFLGYSENNQGCQFAHWINNDEQISLCYILMADGKENVMFETDYVNKVFLSSSTNQEDLLVSLIPGMYCQTFDYPASTLKMIEMAKRDKNRDQYQSSSDSLYSRGNHDTVSSQDSPDESSLLGSKSDEYTALYTLYRNAHEFLIQNGAFFSKIKESYADKMVLDLHDPELPTREEYHEAKQRHDFSVMIRIFGRIVEIMTENMGRYLRSLFLWQFRAGYWIVLRPAILHNRSIEDLCRNRWYKLPK